MKNPFAKTADLNTPHAIYSGGGFTWLILKTYQRPDKESENQNARWFTFASHPDYCPDGEYGDAYVTDIKGIGRLVGGTPEWREYYG